MRKSYKQKVMRMNKIQLNKSNKINNKNKQNEVVYFTDKLFKYLSLIISKKIQ